MRPHFSITVVWTVIFIFKMKNINKYYGYWTVILIFNVDFNYGWWTVIFSVKNAKI